MTTHEPPRLALALLERLVPDSACLAGDLIEQYERRPSRSWLWWQVLGAIAIAWWQRPDEIRPLRLVESQPNDAVERTRRLGRRVEPVNVTASPLNGIGGLGTALLALLMTLVRPAAWWLFLGSVLAGGVLGVAMIVLNRVRGSATSAS
jgi:hypothetical protein